MIHAFTFRCQICPYASRNSSQLIVHLRTHTGDSPFQCQFCDAKFKINTDLKRHMRIHTGEKPYQCDKCDYKCSIKGILCANFRNFFLIKFVHVKVWIYAALSIVINFIMCTSSVDC